MWWFLLNIVLTTLQKMPKQKRPSHAAIGFRQPGRLQDQHCRSATSWRFVGSTILTFQYINLIATCKYITIGCEMIYIPTIIMHTHIIVIIHSKSNTGVYSNRWYKKKIAKVLLTLHEASQQTLTKLQSTFARVSNPFSQISSVISNTTQISPRGSLARFLNLW